MKLLLILILLVSFSMTVSINYIAYTFELETKLGIFFENACTDRQTGKIYVGAKNKLYKLGENLEMISEIDTGPAVDNVNCLYIRGCSLPETLTDSYSKAILIDYENNRLIHCISLHNGICVKHDLKNITRTEDQIYLPMVANTDSATTFAFIAPGPVRDENDHWALVLNIGVQYANNGPVQDRIPSFASRNLYDFSLVNTDLLQQSELRLDFTSKISFPIRYVYGFSSGNYSYMITVQKVKPYNETYVSKIFRVCQRDRNFFTYAEIQLQCRNNGTLYNLAQSAYLGKAGSQLAEGLNISATQDVLYVTFSIGEPGSSVPTNESALCIYPMSNVGKVFTRNIKECFEGKGQTGPEHFSYSEKCITVPGLEIDETYCNKYQRFFEQPVDGPIPVGVDAAITFQSVASALTVDVTSNYTIAFAGSGKGHIFKVVMETQTSATVYEDVEIAEGDAIKSSLLFDIGHEHIYVMTDYKLYKMKLYECCQYTTCTTCLGANNPYCGWCSLENKCSVQKECNQTDEMGWLPYSENFCPNITNENADIQQIPALTSIHPNTGPQSGGTLVTIYGQYLYTDIATTVTIGGHCCSLTDPDRARYSSENASSNESNPVSYTEKYSSNPNELVCKTSTAYKSQLNKQLDVVVHINGTRVSADKNMTYTYVEDPKITSIHPKRSFQSGGRALTIEGSNLFATQIPMMYAVIDGVQMGPENCTRDNTAVIYCPTPKYIDPSTGSVEETDFVNARLGFKMDSVTSVTADNLPLNLGNIMYYPDPSLQNFTEVMEVNNTQDHVVIKGTRLSLAADGPDVKVYIGCGTCDVISMTAEVIVCKPPEDKPVCDESNEQQFIVNVSIGNFHQSVGLLSFKVKSQSAKPSNIGTLVIVIAVICVTVILSTGAILMFCRYRKKHSEGGNTILFWNENGVEEVGLIHDSE
ncbi:plexin-A1-like isoform X2 [Mercenaria mercenaria]|uniref:plexin-A1-like isoform X2 n=1 Tax=Mercenaria mercenaria TaxID=6596 RepID=UPI00234E3CE7|nr:plexin-A1-like isoform X2 [Mercenaria mercenaria]